MRIQLLISILVLFVCTASEAYGVLDRWRCFFSMRKVFLGGAEQRSPAKQKQDAEIRAVYSDLKVDGLKDPSMAIVRGYLRGTTLDWYDYSMPFSTEQIDPLYREVARQLGGRLILAGGSDLIETALLGTGKIASLGEINQLLDKKYRPENKLDLYFQNREVSAPAWKGRPELKNHKMSINGEPGTNLSYYVDNAKQGKYLIEGHPLINVPFKHCCILVVPSKGEARLYFRTVQEFENYSKKILTLPDDEHYPPDWHTSVKQGFAVPSNLYYSIMVYLRAKKQGWQFSPKSNQILRLWSQSMRSGSDEILNEMLNRVTDHAGEQGLTLEEVEAVLKEFGLRS